MKKCIRDFLRCCHLFAICFSLLWLTGCGGAESMGDSAEKAKAAKELIFGKWKMDEESSKKEWGEKTKEWERRMIDELGMTLEFKSGDVATITKGERSGDGYWEIKSSTHKTLEIVAGQSKDAKKKVTMKITFQDANQFVYTNSENDFEVKMIIRRVTQ